MLKLALGGMVSWSRLLAQRKSSQLQLGIIFATQIKGLIGLVFLM